MQEVETNSDRRAGDVRFRSIPTPTPTGGSSTAPTADLNTCLKASLKMQSFDTPCATIPGAIWLVGTRENIEVYQCFIKVLSITTQFSLNINKYSRPHQHSINQISTIGQVLGIISTESQLREHWCDSLLCCRLSQHWEIMDWILMLIKNRESILQEHLEHSTIMLYYV